MSNDKMKNIFKYMLMAGVALMAMACEKEQSLSGEGGVTFDINLASETRAVNGGVFTPDYLTVRIYREDGALIRRYTSMEEIPAPLYLVSGNYTIKVEAGNEENVAFAAPATNDELLDLLSYYGERDFTISAHTNTTIAVACPTTNVKTSVVFDTTSTENENSSLSDVKIQLAAMTSTATTVEGFEADAVAAEATVLNFTGSNTGYFLLPEGVESIQWAFSATHPEDGAVEKVGTIASVAPGKGYKVSFVYSKTPNGTLGLEVFVDDTVEEIENDFDFKPQPELTGEGVDMGGLNVYTSGNSVTFTCESINDMVTLTLGGVAFFSEGQVIEGAIEGVSCTLVEATKLTFTLSSDYFASLKGAYQTLEFGMSDTGGDYTEKVEYVKQGLNSTATTYDLWNNTASFEAVIPESATTVVIRYRKQGATEWAEATATKSGDMTYTATTAPVWNTSTNLNGHTIYTPDTTKSIFANSTYEYQLVVDGVAGDDATLVTTTTQSIPYATLEDTSLSCWGTSNSSAAFWGSGNNTYKKSLCVQSTYTGMQGSYCAKLASSETLGMLAAGNLFTGTFSMNGFSGTVGFGVNYNWLARPSSLKVKVWHKIGAVTTTKYSSAIPEGDPDQASIYVCIIDWDSRHNVTSGADTPTGVWSPENGLNSVSEGEVLGYGIIYPTGTTSGDSMVEIEIPIVWYDTTTKPSKNYTLIVAAATSRYGDYMNGCDSNVMYVDDFQWAY